MSLSLSDAKPPEILILDISVQESLHDPAVPAVKPWATSYINAVQDKGFGDAIWDRYHIFGDVVDGRYEKLTVLETIRKDTMRYKKYEPEMYAEAVAFYTDTMNSANTHSEMIEIIFQVSEQDLSGVDIPEGILMCTNLSSFHRGSACSMSSAAVHPPTQMCTKVHMSTDNTMRMMKTRGRHIALELALLRTSATSSTNAAEKTFGCVWKAKELSGEHVTVSGLGNDAGQVMDNAQAVDNDSSVY